MEYSLGCLRSVPDVRDFKFNEIMTAVELPKAVDLRDSCTPVKEQDGVGGCVAFAVCSMNEFTDRKNKGRYDTLSPRFVYYLCRDKMGTTDYDSGTYINYGLDVLAKRGACLESEFPCDNIYYTYKEMPTGRILRSGLFRKIATYWSISGIDEMKACLAEGFTFVGGVAVYDSFVSEETSKTGDIPMPKWYEKLRGGHAIHFTSYNDSTKRFGFQNSWGSDWGNQGFGSLSYDYIESMSYDFWTIRG